MAGRPEFTGTLAVKQIALLIMSTHRQQVKNGHHPILHAILPAGECVPNDVYAFSASQYLKRTVTPQSGRQISILFMARSLPFPEGNAVVLIGYSMSGKSTYLRQIGLLTVQAMLGCL